MGCSIPDARSQRAVYAFGVELMRTHKYFIGFGITVGIILLVTVTSRMALQGSLLGGTDADASSAMSTSSVVNLQPLGDPLSLKALTSVTYMAADVSVRYALSSAGRTFDLRFTDAGEYISPGTNVFKRQGIESATLHTDRVAVGDIDGDRRPDAVLPVTVRIAGKSFTDLAVVLNKGGDVGEYSTGYALGLGSEVQRIEIDPSYGMRVHFSYLAPGASAPVNAHMTIAVTMPKLEQTAPSSSSSAESSQALFLQEP